MIAVPLALAVAMEVAPGGAVATAIDSTRALPTAALLPVSSVPAASLPARTEVTLARAVGTLPGVQARSASDRLATLVVRGLAGRARVLDAGLPVFDLELLGIDGPAFDPGAVAGVAIARGPRGEDGLGALAGLALVEPAALETTEPGQTWMRTGAEAFGDPTERGLGARLRVDGARGPLGWRLVGAGARADRLAAPATDDGTSKLDARDGELAAGWNAAGVQGGLRFVRFGGTFDRPVGLAGPRHLSRELDDRRLQWEGAAPLGGASFAVRGQWQRRTLDAHDSADPLPPISLRLESYVLRMTGQRDGERWTAKGGVEGLTQTTATTAGRRLIPDARVVQGSVFGSGGIGGARWLATGALRLDVRHLEAADDPSLALPAQSRVLDGWSGSLGATARPLESVTIAARAGRALRAPSLLEAYARGASPGEGLYTIGSRDLEFERGLGEDVLVRWERAPITVEVAGFHQRIEDFVERQALVEVRDGLPVARYGAIDARVFGGEASIRLRVGPGLEGGARLDVASGETDGGGALSQMPAPRWMLDAQSRGFAGMWGATARGRVELEGHGRRTRFGPLDGTSDPYALVNAELELQWAREHGSYRLAARATNLAATRFVEPPSAGQGAAIGPGRRVVVLVSSDLP